MTIHVDPKLALILPSGEPLSVDVEAKIEAFVTQYAEWQRTGLRRDLRAFAGDVLYSARQEVFDAYVSGEPALLASQESARALQQELTISEQENEEAINIIVKEREKAKSLAGMLEKMIAAHDAAECAGSSCVFPIDLANFTLRAYRDSGRGAGEGGEGKLTDLKAVDNPITVTGEGGNP